MEDIKARKKISYQKWAEKNKEFLKEKRKLYREKNKDEMNENAKKYREENPNIVKKNWDKWYANNKDKKLNQQREWRKTPHGHKYTCIKNWTAKGVIGDYDVLYEKYMTTTKCEVCNKEFTDKKKRCLDHDHDTGEFRYVLCASCNDHDYWKKII